MIVTTVTIPIPNKILATLLESFDAKIDQIHNSTIPMFLRPEEYEQVVIACRFFGLNEKADEIEKDIKSMS